MHTQLALGGLDKAPSHAQPSPVLWGVYLVIVRLLPALVTSQLLCEAPVRSLAAVSQLHTTDWQWLWAQLQKYKGRV